MAQSAVTVTPENPTPPTNITNVGSSPPNPATFDPTVYGTDLHYPAPNLAPYYDDGVNDGNSPPSHNEPSGSRIVYAANHAALAVGGSSVAHEGAGTEVLVTSAVANPSPAGQLQMVSCGPVLTPGVMPVPNQTHASSLSPAVNPTLTSIAPNTSVHGTAAITMTATGVGFTRQSKIVINGVPQTTTFVSSTSLTCLATPPAAAGTPAVTVVTGGVVTTAPQTWTIT